MSALLRRSLFAASLALVASVGLTGLGLAHPSSVAADTVSDAKVVIIVGATEGTTSRYRGYADDAYAEAIKHSSNVVKVYSPKATWSRVKAAVAGASVVIYMGHGNGWPSPYTYDPKFTTKNGFGLNATLDDGDDNNKYYGEPHVSTLDLAPNAVILLHHLCYASGNSEPGHADPSRSVARQRVDNYAAGFLAAGARAVIADGHGGPEPYLRALFTSDVSIEDAWRSAPNFNDHVASFASTRTPGATAYTDTAEATSGFYRSLVAQPGLTTAQVRDPGSAPPPAPAAPAPSGQPFADIGGSKFKADIVWLWAEKITAGCSATQFCPDRKVTRGQMASFLARALGLPAATKDYFRDDERSTHESNINRIAKAGLTSGCGSGRFCPNDIVSRAQMASFLARALDLASSSKDYFRDDERSTHESNINRVAKAGLTRGCGTGRYCPSDAVTRGQMAAFLHRAFAD